MKMATKQSLIQERLNLKRTVLDEWNTHEKLCLASAVASSGDQNWMSVSRSLKGIVNSSQPRPNDWFLNKACAIQYGKLLESVETPKRKKRTASERDQPAEAPSTPVESLVKKLTTERIIELKRLIMEDQQEYAKLKEEIFFLQDPNADENRVRAMALEIDQEKVKKEQEQIRYDQWLQERKEKQAEMERQWRPNWRNPKATPKSASESENEQLLQLQTTPTTPGTSSASPLLTSLLKSSSESSPTRSAPTITNLLTTGSTTPLMSQISSPIINASPQIVVQSNANINHSASQIPASLTAPTLITLLDKKPQTSTASVVDKQTNLQSSDGKDSNDPKDDDADLLADFNELIPDKFDDEDLADINAIIMNPEILDDKIVEDEQSKDEDSSQAATTDDYDKLKIKQLVDDFTTVEPVVDQKMPTELEADVGTTPSDVENSNPASMDVVEQPTESNDSKQEEQTEEKVVIISDESSNTNDEKQPEDNESQPSAAEEDSKEVPGTSENSESKAGFQAEDSDDDGAFEDAKDKLDDSEKTNEDKTENLDETKPEVEPEIKTEKEVKEEKMDSDDEALGVKVSRGSRKKPSESSSRDTRSRDHSIDDNHDSIPIPRTRSRQASVIEPKSSFNFTKEQDHSMWKARWDDCLKELQKLKDYSLIMDNKIMSDESTKSIIMRPMNIKLIGKNIENNHLTMPSDIKRDFGLLCTNIIMSPHRDEKFIEKVEKFMKDALDVIDTSMEVEEAYKSYREKIRKKQN